MERLDIEPAEGGIVTTASNLIWGVLILAIKIAIIWSLTAHGQDLATTR